MCQHFLPTSMREFRAATRLAMSKPRQMSAINNSTDPAHSLEALDAVLQATPQLLRLAACSTSNRSGSSSSCSSLPLFGASVWDSWDCGSEWLHRDSRDSACPMHAGANHSGCTHFTPHHPAGFTSCHAKEASMHPWHGLGPASAFLSGPWADKAR